MTSTHQTMPERPSPSGAAADGMGRRFARRWRTSLLGLLTLLMVWHGPGFSTPRLASQEKFPEYQLKAAFLFNFARFVTWPEKAFDTPKSPIVIGIVGTDPFGPLLENLLRDKKIHGRSVVVKRIAPGKDPVGCQAVFVSRTDKHLIPKVLKYADGKHILTISEVDKFANHGGMINLVNQGNSIRFEINLEVTQAAGLQVSSQLANLSIRVKSEKKPPTAE